MDGSHFDTVVKTFATRRLTRGQTLRGLATGMIAALLGLRLVAEEAQGQGKNNGKGKKTRRRRRKNKKQLVCTCSASSCTQQKVKNPTALINQNSRCNYAGACASNPCAATVPLSPLSPLGPPPPGCVPEPQATTCAGAPCGSSRFNNCGQAVTCTCPPGQTCLANGTCALPCTGTESCANCTPQGSECAGRHYNGDPVCFVITNVPCTERQICNTFNDTDCPQGFLCSGCGETHEPRCFPVPACS